MALHLSCPKTVVIGADGFIGKHFLEAYRRSEPDTIGTTRRGRGTEEFYLDLSEPDISRLNLKERGFRDAVLLAANPKIDACESGAGETRKINVDGTLKLIEQLVGEGVKPIFFSSDYVFDGIAGSYEDDAAKNPITEYGRHKAEVEDRIGEIAGDNFMIVRPGKVYALEKRDGTLLDEMADALSSGTEIRAAYDQMMNPTLIDDLVKAVMALQGRNATGTYNVCSPERWSRYDIGTEMARALGVDEGMVKKISLDDLGFVAKRPKNTSMVPARLTAEMKDLSFTPLKKSILRVAENWRV